NMTYFTLNEAAKQTGKSKSTISKYLKEGKISYIEKTENGYKLDPSEVFRVFAKIEHETGINEQTRTTGEHIEHKVLEKEIELLRERLADKEQENSKLWKRLDAEAEERRKLTMMLSDMREKTPQNPIERRKGFLATLLSKNS
ncbi:MAG: MerR family transcriptional regulator, partial [Flammeovirgaceae bacterium]